MNEDTQQHSWACRSSVAGLPARRTRRGQSERTDFSPGRLRRGNHQGAGKTESSTLSGRSLDYRNKNTASSTSSSTSSTGWFSLRRDEGQSRPESERQNARKQAWRSSSSTRAKASARGGLQWTGGSCSEGRLAVGSPRRGGGAERTAREPRSRRQTATAGVRADAARATGRRKAATTAPAPPDGGAVAGVCVLFGGFGPGPSRRCCVCCFQFLV